MIDLEAYPNLKRIPEFRKPPEGAQLVETRVHAGWVDLCWRNEAKGCNVYITTRPDHERTNH